MQQLLRTIKCCIAFGRFNGSNPPDYATRNYSRCFGEIFFLLSMKKSLDSNKNFTQEQESLIFEYLKKMLGEKKFQTWIDGTIAWNHRDEHWVLERLTSNFLCIAVVRLDYNLCALLLENGATAYKIPAPISMESMTINSLVDFIEEVLRKLDERIHIAVDKNKVMTTALKIKELLRKKIQEEIDIEAPQEAMALTSESSSNTTVSTDLYPSPVEIAGPSAINDYQVEKSISKELNCQSIAEGILSHENLSESQKRELMQALIQIAGPVNFKDLCQNKDNHHSICTVFINDCSSGHTSEFYDTFVGSPHSIFNSNLPHKDSLPLLTDENIKALYKVGLGLLKQIAQAQISNKPKSDAFQKYCYVLSQFLRPDEFYKVLKFNPSSKANPSAKRSFLDLILKYQLRSEYDLILARTSNSNKPPIAESAFYNICEQLETLWKKDSLYFTRNKDYQWVLFPWLTSVLSWVDVNQNIYFFPPHQEEEAVKEKGSAGPGYTVFSPCEIALKHNNETLLETLLSDKRLSPPDNLLEQALNYRLESLENKWIFESATHLECIRLICRYCPIKLANPFAISEQMKTLQKCGDSATVTLLEDAGYSVQKDSTKKHSSEGESSSSSLFSTLSTFFSTTSTAIPSLRHPSSTANGVSSYPQPSSWTAPTGAARSSSSRNSFVAQSGGNSRLPAISRSSTDAPVQDQKVNGAKLSEKKDNTRVESIINTLEALHPETTPLENPENKLKRPGLHHARAEAE